MGAPLSFGDDLELDDLGDGRFEATITDRWWIVIGPNGGLLAALALKAALEANRQSEVPDLDPAMRLTPRALTIQFLAAAVEGTINLEVVTERVGRRIGVFTVRVTQGDRLLVLGRVTLGQTLENVFDVDDHEAPQVSGPADTPIVPLETDPKNSRQRWTVREVFDGVPVGGAPGLVSGGWMQLNPPEPIDALVLAALADNWPPSIRGHIDDERLHTITLEYHVYFRARTLPLAVDDHALVMLRSASSIDGYHQEDAEIWSENGELLATARQLALVFRRND